MPRQPQMEYIDDRSRSSRRRRRKTTTTTSWRVDVFQQYYEYYPRRRTTLSRIESQRLGSSGGGTSCSAMARKGPAARIGGVPLAPTLARRNCESSSIGTASGRVEVADPAGWCRVSRRTISDEVNKEQGTRMPPRRNSAMQLVGSGRTRRRCHGGLGRVGSRGSADKIQRTYDVTSFEQHIVRKYVRSLLCDLQRPSVAVKKNVLRPPNINQSTNRPWKPPHLFLTENNSQSNHIHHSSLLDQRTIMPR